MSELTITDDDAGQRLDRFLRKVLPAATLGQIFAGLRRGAVTVNGVRARGDLRLQTGDRVVLRGSMGALPLGRRTEPSAARVPLDVVFRDGDLLVVAKPAGLAVHPGSGVDRHLLGAVRAIEGQGRGHSFAIAPAHRLDRDTSGLVVFGRSARGLRGFTAALRSGAVAKTYLALVHGVPYPSGTVELPLMRTDAPRGRKVQVAVEGRPAVTRWRTLAVRGGRALLAIDLATGRTHQIRAHLAALGHPIVGDRRYGRPDGARRLHLHAWGLAFRHPVSGVPLELFAEPPAELRA
ncbi:MAG TPA: RluA family pseudouridine synthase [Planctomycetota bacterium]|nr:RluA family pseudouridine synthase [Planctomycetota bacterium]